MQGIDSLYEVRPGDIHVFDDFRKASPQVKVETLLHPGEALKHGGWTPVARFSPVESDGHINEIDISAMPARFYRVRGERFTLSTGSGEEMALLAARIAFSAAQGMIGASTPEDGE